MSYQDDTGDVIAKSEAPTWSGGDLAGKTLVVRQDQGIGATFRTLRFLAMAAQRAGKVVFVCDDAFLAVLRRLELFRGDKIDVVASTAPLPAHDGIVGLLALEKILDVSPDRLPSGNLRISLDEARVKRWTMLGAGPNRDPLRVGLCWKEEASASNGNSGSYGASLFMPLSACGDRVQFIALASDDGSGGEFATGLNMVFPGKDLDAAPDAFVDSAALLMTLDLVITVDSAVAHLAGLLGRPVWLLLDAEPDACWGEEGILTPWYRTMRVFRQDGNRDRTAIMSEVAKDLQQLAPAALKPTTEVADSARKALALQVQGKVKAAREIYQSLHGAARRDSQFLNFFAMAVLEEGRRGAQSCRLALPLAAHSVALRPKGADFWSNFSVLLESMGAAKDSLRALNFAVEADPAHVPSLISLAKRETASGRLKGALVLLERAAKVQPNSVPLLTALAATHAELADYPEAERFAQRAVQQEPRNARLWVQLGKMQSANGKQADAAGCWERAICLDPKNADAYGRLGAHEREFGEREIACMLLRRAVSLDPQHVEAWIDLGISEREAGREVDARAALRRALEIRPDHERALARLADGQQGEIQHRGDAPSAVTKPEDFAETYRLAQTAQRAGDGKKAVTLYASVLPSPRFQAAAMHMLGSMSLAGDRNHRAVIYMEMAAWLGLKSPELMTNYAIGLRRIGRIDEAIALLEQVLAEKPTAEAHLSLANIFRDAFRFDEALQHYSASLALKPGMSKSHRGYGNLMRDMHRPEESLAAFERARALDNKDPDLILDHAHAKLYAGDFAGGFADYEARWQSKEMRPRSFDRPRWDGKPAADKVILIHGEQGFGDNIQFVRFVAAAAQMVKQVILEVRPALVRLFQSLESPAGITVVAQGQVPQAYDFEMPMMSLPLVFGTTPDTLPPPARFQLDPARVAHWRGVFPAKGVNVGLIWQGNPNARADAGRSPPLAALEPLFSIHDCNFISLQKSDGLDQIRNAAFARDIIVPGDSLGDFYETAQAISALDVVVSSCTATLHLAASLGVPVLGMLKYHADWRWMHERSDSPWYPSLTLFRQAQVRDWQSAVTPLAAALQRFVAGNAPKT